VQTPQLLTHKISSKSVNNFFRYPAKIQKSGVNLVPGSKPDQFVQAPVAINPLNFIEICPYLLEISHLN